MGEWVQKRRHLASVARRSGQRATAACDPHACPHPAPAPGLPLGSVQLPGPEQGGADGNEIIIADVGTNQLEFGALARATGAADYQRRSEQGPRFVHAANPDTFLLPTQVQRDSGKPSSMERSVGGTADSYCAEGGVAGTTMYAAAQVPVPPRAAPLWRQCLHAPASPALDVQTSICSSTGCWGASRRAAASLCRCRCGYRRCCTHVDTAAPLSNSAPAPHWSTDLAGRPLPPPVGGCRRTSDGAADGAPVRRALCLPCRPDPHQPRLAPHAPVLLLARCGFVAARGCPRLCLALEVAGLTAAVPSPLAQGAWRWAC